MTKRLIVLFFIAVLAIGQEHSPVTTVDIAGDGVVHAVASGGTARSIIFVAPPSNSSTNCGTSAISGCVRVGDTNISTSRGMPIGPGGQLTLPESAGAQRYGLNNWYYLVQSGDKLVILYLN